MDRDGGEEMTDARRARRPERWIAIAFLSSAVASVALTVVYALGGQTQIEGALLGLALGGIAIGLVAWARTFLPQGPYEQARFDEPADARDEQRAEAALEAGAETIGRRRMLARLGAAAVTALGIAAVFPVRSLGTRPGRSLFATAWRPGSRLVTSEGDAVRAGDVAVNAFLTVFPEGRTDAADSQAVLIRLPAGTSRPMPGREDWAPDGLVCFSKICTHAGCPVGLYAAQTQELFCPCHQSVFDVRRGARPTGGPATRALPQLPIAVDDEGFLVAQSDFREPVGPGFFSRPGG